MSTILSVIGKMTFQICPHYNIKTQDKKSADDTNDYIYDGRKTMKKKRRAWLQGLLLACFLCVAAVIPSSTVNAEIISRTLTSQIAGYYLLCDNDPGNSNYLYHLISEQEHYIGSYTWTDKNASINNTNLKNMGLGFNSAKDTSLDVTSFIDRYLHIAAVDAAGNIGPTSTIEIARTNVFKLKFIYKYSLSIIVERKLLN